MDTDSQHVRLRNDQQETNAETEPDQTEENLRPDNQVEAGISYVSESEIKISGRDNITYNIQVTSSASLRKIIQSLGGEIRPRQVVKPLSSNAPLHQQVEHWFNHDLANDRERFFVITLSIFHGLRYPHFKNIYETLVQMREVIDETEDKDTPTSRFIQSDKLLIEKARAETLSGKTGREEILRFKDDQYTIAIFDLMRRNSRNELLDLLPVLKLVVEKFQNWEVRYLATLAIAKISRLDFDWVRGKVFEPWATDHRAYVRAAVGYPLAYLAEDDEFRSTIENLLTDWTNNRGGGSEAQRYRWTVASVYKQIGSIEADWAMEAACRGLKTIASFEDLDLYLTNAVIHSLVVLSLQGRLTDILLVLKSWIEDDNSKDKKQDQTTRNCCVTAILAFMVLSEVHIELDPEARKVANELEAQVKNLFDIVRRSETEKGEIWQLTVAVGVKALEYRIVKVFDSQVSDAFFDLITRWAHYASNNSRSLDIISNLITQVYVKASRFRQQKLWNRLGHWEVHRTDKILSQLASSAKTQINAIAEGKTSVSLHHTEEASPQKEKSNIKLHDEKKPRIKLQD
ncbi:MAG: hypothetical protein HS114_00830 [Anaerolineales bacterium]|nr:hypothetical protein [Anaerolineales bacterium]